MGCGASKEDIAEPRPIQRCHGRDNLQQIDNEATALKPINLTSDCICSLYDSESVVLKNPSSPPSALHILSTPGSGLSSDEDDEDDEDFGPNSFDIPSKLSIVEGAENDASQTTALAALSGEKTVTDKEVEERVEAILAADDDKFVAEQSDECCALDTLTSQSAVLQALLSTGPVITQQNLGADLSTRVGHMAVISGPEPIRWEPTLRKAEIIDLDVGCSCVLRPPLRIISQEEPDAGESVMVENTPELQQDNQSDQEPADDDDHHALTEEQSREHPKPDDAIDTVHKTLFPGPEPRKPKLPPLTIIPPILVEIPANPFVKPAFPIVLKQDLMEVKAPFVCETEQFEVPSADRTPPNLAQLREDSPNENNHDVKSKSSLVTEHEDGTPTPATKSPADSEWRSLHRDTPDPDIESIDLLESPELDSVPMLDCHGIHKDKKDLIIPGLRVIA